MMTVLITGGAGFLGRRLALKILERGWLRDASGEKRGVGEVIVSDVAAPLVPFPEDPRLVSVVGPFGDPGMLERLVTPQTGVIFHLAAVVSGGAEEDFELGMEVNFLATQRLLERVRSLGTRPRVVFASSVAVYGGELPEVLDDHTRLTPQTSYGAQKAMVEFLLNDYSRRGFLDGRALRLPTIVVRPGLPNKAASSFASSVVREPLQGSAYTCPVPPETGVWILSPRRVVEAFVHAALLEEDAWGDHRALPLPGITTTVQEMVDVLHRLGGPRVTDRIRWEPDPGIQKIVATWPIRFDPRRALDLGFEPDTSVPSIIQAFIDDELGGQIA